MALLYSVQACSSNPGLAMLPIAEFLKADLGLTAAQVMGFRAIAFLPWFLKPLFGFVADSFLFWGFRFKGYLVACYAGAIFVFLGLSRVGDYSYGGLLGGIVAVSGAIAFSDVVADKLMITQGKATGTTARLQGAQWVGLGLSGAAILLLGGWLADRVSLSVVFGLSAIGPVLGIWGVLQLLKEPRQQASAVLGDVRTTMRSLWKTIRQRHFLLVMLLIVLLGFCPIPPTYFYQRDALQFSNTLIGQLNAVSLLGTGLGALLFGRLSSWLSRGNLVYGVVGFSAIATVSLGLMQGVGSAIAISLFTGASTIWATLLMFELVIKTCPEGGGGNGLCGGCGAVEFGGFVGFGVGGLVVRWGAEFCQFGIAGSRSNGSLLGGRAVFEEKLVEIALKFCS